MRLDISGVTLIPSPRRVSHLAASVGQSSALREATMNNMTTTRRTLLAGLAGTATFGAHGAYAATAPAMPASPVALNVIDVGGQLQLTQGAMDAYAKANPKLVSKI